MNERRQSPRGEVEVEILLSRASGGESVRLLTRNLGPDGLLVITSHKISLGDSCTVSLALEDGGKPIRCESEVVWVQAFPRGSRRSVGIGFRGLAEEERRRIAAHVEAHRSHLADFLREFPMFDGLTDEDLQCLGSLCFRQTLLKGDLFYREGEQGDTLFIIEHGTVKIFREDAQGDERLIATASSGELFGEMSLVTTHPHGASVRAVVDTRILGMTQGGYAFLKWKYPRTAVHFSEILMRFLCARLERTNKRLLEPAPMERR